jgi:hypothetical protein
LGHILKTAFESLVDEATHNKGSDFLNGLYGGDQQRQKRI